MSKKSDKADKEFSMKFEKYVGIGIILFFVLGTIWMANSGGEPTQSCGQYNTTDCR